MNVGIHLIKVSCKRCLGFGTLCPFAARGVCLFSGVGEEGPGSIALLRVVCASALHCSHRAHRTTFVFCFLFFFWDRATKVLSKSGSWNLSDFEGQCSHFKGRLG